MGVKTSCDGPVDGLEELIGAHCKASSTRTLETTMGPGADGVGSGRKRRLRGRLFLPWTPSALGRR